MVPTLSKNVQFWWKLFPSTSAIRFIWLNFFIDSLELLFILQNGKSGIFLGKPMDDDVIKQMTYRTQILLTAINDDLISTSCLTWIFLFLKIFLKIIIRDTMRITREFFKKNETIGSLYQYTKTWLLICPW